MSNNRLVWKKDAEPFIQGTDKMNDIIKTVKERFNKLKCKAKINYTTYISKTDEEIFAVQFKADLKDFLNESLERNQEFISVLDEDYIKDMLLDVFYDCVDEDQDIHPDHEGADSGFIKIDEEFELGINDDFAENWIDRQRDIYADGGEVEEIYEAACSYYMYFVYKEDED